MATLRDAVSKVTSLPTLGLVSVLLGTASLANAASPTVLPGDFVFLRDVDPTIQQDIRYATPHNFTGKPLPGYDGAECVLKKAAAAALHRVQQEVASRNLSLKVFDCYRPVRAVTAMAQWANDGTLGETTRNHFPRTPKTELFPRGYIASRSGHSLGATVDLSLADLGAPANTDTALQAACDAPAAQRGAADGIDMGTSFDCFDPRSATDSKDGITDEQQRRRFYLRDVLTRHGFSNYPAEWWHYTYNSASSNSAAGHAYDFPIPKR